MGFNCRVLPVTLKLIINAPKFVPNQKIHNDLQVPKVKHEIKKQNENYLNR